jgi:transposase InsO family protein
MPWNNWTDQEERLRFVYAARSNKATMAAWCRQYGISRKTGYKWLGRYERGGLAGLTTRSRRPKRLRSWSRVWRRRICAWRLRRPTWGARKLQDKLRRQWPRRRLPAVRTVQRWLAQARLSRPCQQRAKAGPKATRPPRIIADRPNAVWTVDFKGPMRAGRQLEPLTVFDLASRYGLAAQLLPAKDYRHTRATMFRLFRRHGLPRAIQVDNGPPFGGGGSLGLTRLTAEWRRLGIQVQFGRPACPQDNAEHERWHRTLQEDLTALPAGAPAQACLNRILRLYNTDRAHEALGMRRPVEIYHRSRRLFRGLPQPRRYPAQWARVQVGVNGYAWWAGRSRLFGAAFGQQRLGLCPSQPGHWQVFLDHLLIGLLVATDRAGMRPLQLQSPPPGQSGEGFALPSTPPLILK